MAKRLSRLVQTKEIDHVQHRPIRHLHPRRPHREAPRLRRHAARRARRVRPAQGSRRGAGRAARGRGAAASTTSTPATSTARTSPTSSSARRCTPIPTISSSSPRSARGAATDGSWIPALLARRTDAGGARQPAQSRARRARRRQPARSCSTCMAPPKARSRRRSPSLAELQRQGLVRHIGLSNVTADADRGRTRGSPRSSACRTSTTWRIATTTR